MDFLTHVADQLLTQAGAVAFLLFLGVVAAAFLYWIERADRMKAWTKYTELAQSSNEVLGKLHLTLEGMKEILRK